MNASADLARFYSILGKLDASPEQGRTLGAYARTSVLPKRGVYFFREPHELRQANPSTQRVVRVGTHAVSANARSTLWQRLRTHLGTSTGSGNHRGSIFRLHVGAALLARDHLTLPTWGVGSVMPLALRQSPDALAEELKCETAVSSYIGQMTVLWIEIPDEPSPLSVRAIIERNAIALLSNNLAPLDPASSSWLGHYSPRSSIRRSGLWNLNHVEQDYDPRFLDLLDESVERSLRSR